MRIGLGLGRSVGGSALAGDAFKEHGVARALHQIHNGLTCLLKHLGVVVTLGHDAQESAANGVGEIELVWTAGQDKCLKNGAHLELQLGKLVGLRLVEVLGCVGVEVEHGNGLLD